MTGRAQLDILNGTVDFMLCWKNLDRLLMLPPTIHLTVSCNGGRQAGRR